MSDATVSSSPSLSDEIVAWATEYKIERFLDQFAEAGFDTMEVLGQIEAEDLDWMKISRPGDRKKVMIAVRSLKEKEIQVDTPLTVEEIDDRNELVALESSQEMKEGKMSVLQLSDMLNSLSPLLSQGHRIYEGNPLHLAVCQGDVQEVSRLVKKIKEGKLNVDINELCGDSKSTVLHTAVSMGDIEIVKILLSIDKLNHKTRDGRGRSVLLSAIALEHIPLLNLLLEHDQKRAENFEGTNNQGDVSESLVLEYDGGNRSYLYLACCTKNEEIVRTLLQFEPKKQINRPNKDQERHTPLFAAVTRGDTHLCCVLLSEYDADPNITDAAGSSPLVCAVVDHDDSDLVDALLKYGANPTQIDESGMTALDIAAALDKKSLVKVLLAYEQEQQKRAAADL